MSDRDDDRPTKVENLPVATPQLKEGSSESEIVSPSAALLREMLDVERQRIASADRKTDVNLRAIQAYDEADKREYDLERHRIDTENEHRRGVFSFLKLIVGGTLLAATIVVGVALFFLFGDEPERRLIAENIIKYMFTAVGGYGVLQVLMRIINRTLGHK